MKTGMEKVRKGNTYRKEQGINTKGKNVTEGRSFAGVLVPFLKAVLTLTAPAHPRYTVAEKKGNTVSDTALIIGSKTQRLKHILNLTHTFSSKSFICLFWMSVLSSKSRILWKKGREEKVLQALG